MAAPSQPSSAPSGRFRRLTLHAGGSASAVYLASDEELHRVVALKEIQDHAHHAGSDARFVFEAEVTAALEHPGIVPVYGMGRYPDSRPFSRTRRFSPR